MVTQFVKNCVFRSSTHPHLSPFMIQDNRPHAVRGSRCASPWVFSLSVLTLAIQTAYAADVAMVELDTVSVSVRTGAYGGAKAGTAAAVAPTQASLDATQPQSIITREFIDLSVAPTTEYSRIVNIAPSMAGEAANGPGLGETKETLRGFSDDQYNITFDGVPWGDTNNPAHHSTSFFPGSVIGGATVERGPGNASNLGFATFGGSVNLYSKKPSRDAATSAFMTVGTWNTRLLGASYESGRMGSTDTTLQLNYQNLQSDGYLSYSPIKSQNLTVKLEGKVTENSVLTFFSSVNTIKYQQPDSNKGATLSQIAKFGKNFQLDNDPSSMNFWGYNFTNKDTDFEYLRLRSDLEGGWSTDNALYTYAYNNQTTSSTDPTWTGTAATATDPRSTKSLSGTTIKGNIPGIDKQNKYRVWGDIFKAARHTEDGLLRVGVWLESSTTDRHQYDLDLTTGQYNRAESPVNATALPGTDRPIDSVKFDQQSTIRSAQPFVEYEWAATPSTQVTPGLKYVSITRSQTSPVAQTTRIVNDAASMTYTTTLPFLTVNHKLDPQTSVYGQYAKGFQIPDLNTFYVANPGKSSTEPQKTTNYQVGVVGRSDRMTWDADVYRIEFVNKLVSNGMSGADAGFVNIGGATYQGIEGQMAYVVGDGVSLYANASVNSAKANDTGLQISGAPEATAALGLLYNANAWSGSLIYKHTGSVRQKEYDPAKGPINGTPYYDYYQTAAYGTLDLGLAYTLQNGQGMGKKVKIQLNVFNLLDSSAVTSVSTGKTLPYDTYVYQTPRSVQLSLKVDM